MRGAFSAEGLFNKPVFNLMVHKRIFFLCETFYSGVLSLNISALLVTAFSPRADSVSSTFDVSITSLQGFLLKGFPDKSVEKMCVNQKCGFCKLVWKF